MMPAVFIDSPFKWSDPHTWPWFLYVWFLFIVAGWIKPMWRWFRRQQWQTWPIAQGFIESDSVEQKKRFVDSRIVYVAQLNYSYSVASQTYRGHWRQEFPDEDQTEEAVRDLKGKSIIVAYHPAKPPSSVLPEDAMATLRAGRPPASEESLRSGLKDIPWWVKPLL